MPVVACTVFSPRSHGIYQVLDSQTRLGGIARRAWLANGLSDVEYGRLAGVASKLPQPTTLFRCREVLPIARSHNHLLRHAAVEHPGSDCLILQDDVLAPPELPSALSASEYDVPAAWHDDRPPKKYEACGLQYVVFMAVLLRSRVLDRVGYLNEMFMRGVDAEFGCRASAAGLTCGFVPWPRVHHVGRVTTGGDNAGTRMVHQQALGLIRYLHRRGLLAEYRGAQLNARHGIRFTRADFEGWQ